jgi:hypothetical protein
MDRFCRMGALVPTGFTGMPVPSPLAAVTRGGRLAERLELRPGDVGVDAAAEAAVRRGDDAVGADDVGEPADALRDQLGVLHDVRRVADDAGHEHQVVGHGGIRPRAELVLVADVAGLERDRADVRLQHDGQDVLQLDVGGVRPCHDPSTGAGAPAPWEARRWRG